MNDISEILCLIKQEHGTDDYGDDTVTERHRRVFVRISSVGQQEFYQAHAVGLKPELKCVLADYLDYEGERLAELDGQRYHILRTFRKGMELELTLYQEVNPA
jgi:hypothetical protein